MRYRQPLLDAAHVRSDRMPPAGPESIAQDFHHGLLGTIHCTPEAPRGIRSLHDCHPEALCGRPGGGRSCPPRPRGGHKPLISGDFSYSAGFSIWLLAPLHHRSAHLRWSRFLHPVPPERVRWPGKGPVLPSPRTEKFESASFQTTSHTPPRLLPSSDLFEPPLRPPIRPALAGVKGGVEVAHQGEARVDHLGSQEAGPKVTAFCRWWRRASGWGSRFGSIWARCRRPWARFPFSGPPRSRLPLGRFETSSPRSRTCQGWRWSDGYTASLLPELCTRAEVGRRG